MTFRKFIDSVSNCNKEFDVYIESGFNVTETTKDYYSVKVGNIKPTPKFYDVFSGILKMKVNINGDKVILYPETNLQVRYIKKWIFTLMGNEEYQCDFEEYHGLYS